MIVLDDNLDLPDVLEPLRRWTKGRAVCLRDLRAGTVIKDDALQVLLRRQTRPTFVTTNTTDFWGRVPADKRYCIVCLPLPNERHREIPTILRRLFRHPEFRTQSARMGTVVRVSDTDIRFHRVGASAVVRIEPREFGTDEGEGRPTRRRSKSRELELAHR